MLIKPILKPKNPFFSSGPCGKRPGWELDALKGFEPGRSHRSSMGKARLKALLDLSRSILKLPDDYRIAVVPASDTGAVEMALWSLLGERGVDMLAWDSFGSGWVSDVQNQLKLDDVRVFKADYGDLPDLSAVDCDRDVVFTWNGTTAGVRVPNGNWIPADRQGLTICDATSAAFAIDLPWDKLDVVTYSWQKVMGGEGGHGMLILSPRAVERLESYTPPWPLPKIFRMTKNGKLIKGIFDGATINTPSMLAVEDAIDGLRWAENNGGLGSLIERTNNNAKAVDAWVQKTPWVRFLAENPDYRSPTSICLAFDDPQVCALDEAEQRALAKRIVSRVEAEGAGYDFGAYRDAPPGLRLWGGAMMETSDLEALFPWLDWAYHTELT